MGSKMLGTTLATIHGKKAPVRREKVPYINSFLFSRGEVERLCLPPPPGLPMSKGDNKMNTIFENYSAHNYIKIHSRMHPIALFHKKMLVEHTLESPSN